MTQEVMIQIFESDFNADGLIQTVNARDLHEALGVGRDFTNWIKYQLEDFKENQDFIIFAKNGEKSRGRPTKDYALTLDAAKHICMMSRCEKGRQLRQYFIEVEKQYRLGYTAEPAAPQQQTQLIPGTPEHFNKCFTECFTQAYSTYFGKPAQTALTDQQQHTEPVALPPVGEHHSCPTNKISLNKMKSYVSNEKLLKELISGFGLVGEMFDPGCVEGTNKKARPYMVYDKKQVAAMLKAAQVKASKEENGKRKLLRRTFQIETNVSPNMYDSFDFDAACEMILLLEAEKGC